MGRVTILITLSVLLLLPFVSAQPQPFQQNAQDQLGYELRTIAFESHKFNTEREFTFHVYNLSSGYPVNTSISCVFHLYDSNGTHQAIQYNAVPAHAYDYEFSVNKNNFSSLSEHSYLTQCNDSRLGGFIANSFYVTPTGKVLHDGEEWIQLSSLAFVIFLSLIFLLMALFLPPTLTPVKIFSVMFGLLLLIGSSGLLVNLTQSYILSNGTLVNLMGYLFILLSVLFFGGLTLLLVYVAVQSIKFMKQSGRVPREKGLM